jgi:glycerol-3-phosphate dehydrogenase
MKKREERLKYLREFPNISVLIIGAGINGIGTFRDLALQGVDVAIIDKGDYCSGTSSASSHMVHGGIRYLENGEFRLVKEAVQERNRLIENAPHLVKPLATTIPTFKWFSGLSNAPLKFIGLLDQPTERGAIVIKIGMLLYDFFTRKQKTVPSHKFENKRSSVNKFPKINPDILFTGTYFDGAMPSPERIAIELLQDTVDTNDTAIPLNYVSFEGVNGNNILLKDNIRGETFEITPQVVVNATGPWIDLVNKSIGKQTSFISGTKGSHIVLDNPELRKAIGENEIFFENDDGRIVLLYPLHSKVLVGTTDIPINNLENIVITEEEVDYFFSMISKVFPTIEVKRYQIIYTFSGVRPLQNSGGKTAGQISRDHVVKITEPNSGISFPVLSLVGGKWTSFRAFSENSTDIVLKQLGKDRKINTQNLAIGGGKKYPKNQTSKTNYLKELSNKTKVNNSLIDSLFNTFGTHVEKLISDYSDELSIPLNSIPALSIGELKYYINDGDIQHLDDLLLRRTMIAKLGFISKESLEEIADICADILGWEKEEKTHEINRFNKIYSTRNKMKYRTFSP